MDLPGQTCGRHSAEDYSFRLLAAASAAGLAKPVSVSLLEPGATDSGGNRRAIRKHSNGVVCKTAGLYVRKNRFGSLRRNNFIDSLTRPFKYQTHCRQIWRDAEAGYRRLHIEDMRHVQLIQMKENISGRRKI